MAEPIGIAPDLMALATFAFQSSVGLYHTVQSYHGLPKRVRDLNEELQSLNEVLGGLNETLRSNHGSKLTALERPLLRCGNARQHFEEEIRKCSTRSSSGRKSFRDWAKMRYMGQDIDGFRQMMAGYKSTIIIALTDANFLQSSVTANNLESYKEMIETTTGDLEAHLETIDEKLEKIIAYHANDSSADSGELQQMEEERLCTRKCLEICSQLSRHIEQIQDTQKSPHDAIKHNTSSSISETVTNEGLQECKNSLSNTAAKLETHLRALIDRIIAKSRTAIASPEDIADMIRLQEEWETTGQCMHICSQAEVHLPENVSTIDNYATGDAIQFMVSTDGKIIHGKYRGLEWRTRQVGGHLNDASLQQLSRDMNRMSFPNTKQEHPPSGGDSHSSCDEPPEDQVLSDFRERYSEGFKLAKARPAASVASMASPPTNGQ